MASRTTRRALSVKPTIERSYRRRIGQRIARLHRELRLAILGVLRTTKDPFAVRAVVRVVEQRWRFPRTSDVLPAGRAMASSTVTNVTSVMSRLGRVPINVPDRDTAVVLAGWAVRNVRLIKRIEARHFDDVQRVVLEGLNRGLRTREVGKQLSRRFGITRRRGQLIARDQLATLNMEITRARQTSLGVTRFRWRTSADGRVREEHAELEGQVFTWAEGHPTEGVPGQAINCRCVAEPILDEGFAEVVSVARRSAVVELFATRLAA